MAEGTGDPEPASTLPRFRDLDARKRLKVALCVAFATFHIAATLVRGAWPGLRDPLLPFVNWYAEGLRMASIWGMFSKPPDPTDVVVMGVRMDGTREELSHTDPQRRDWFGRIVDVRLRKIQNRLDNEEDRKAWGRPYLEYFCRNAGHGLRRVELELVEHPVDATAESEENPAQRTRVLTVPCKREAAGRP